MFSTTFSLLLLLEQLFAAWALFLDYALLFLMSMRKEAINN